MRKQHTKAYGKQLNFIYIQEQGKNRVNPNKEKNVKA